MGAARQIVNEQEFDNLVNQYNKDLVKDFLIEKKAQRKSPNTIKQYRYDMRIILTLILHHFENKRLTDLTRKDIRNLSIVLQERGISNARVNRQMSCLRSCLEFAADDDDYNYEHNVGSRVKGLPKAPVREITFLSEEQINWLKNNTLIENGDYLKAVYLMLSYFSAARKNEVYQVQKEGLTHRFFTNTVTGKRNKKFKLYYNQEVQDLIKMYLKERGEDDLPELFVRVYREYRRAVSVSTFNDWCDYFGMLLSNKEGKEIHVNPHCFRHSRLDNLSRSGIPIEKLKTLANHENISTTADYLADRGEEDIAEIFGMNPKDFV